MRFTGEKLNKFLAELPSTNWIRFVGSLLIAGTAVVVWILALRGVEWDHIALAEWLTFLAAIEGISYRQFRAKRETYVDYVKAKNGPAQQAQP